ncbi:MAG: helix-turn-helix transcriptional regulator, partial [Oscillospiraceae bacterium]|nr:helix-turn-helix transcriptional regulator [Oscillospiraceae bacterium]
MKTDYSPKEIAILGGVLKLARQGADITKITSRQIASAAGMGKATIYDYFSTKEEIIFAALAWSMSQQAAEFAQAM